MSDAPEVQAARARAALAKARLQATLGELQAKVSPTNVAEDVKEAAARHKVPLAGAAGVFGLYLARKPISSLVRRLTRRQNSQPNKD